MEVVLLLVLWAFAAFAAELRNFGFSLFLVFVSIGVMAWRWRAKLADVGNKLEAHAHDAESLRAELKQVAQELRLLKSALAAPPTQPIPVASHSGTEDVKPTATQPIPRPEPGSEQKPAAVAPARVQPAPPVNVPAVAKPVPTTPSVPPSQPAKVSAPVFASVGSTEVPGAPSTTEQKTPP